MLQIPESPKWHFSYGRDEIGKKIATKFAKHNNKILTERDWEDAAVRKVCKSFNDSMKRFLIEDENFSFTSEIN